MRFALVLLALVASVSIALAAEAEATLDSSEGSYSYFFLFSSCSTGRVSSPPPSNVSRAGHHHSTRACQLSAHSLGCLEFLFELVRWWCAAAAPLRHSTIGQRWRRVRISGRVAHVQRTKVLDRVRRLKLESVEQMQPQVRWWHAGPIAYRGAHRFAVMSYENQGRSSLQFGTLRLRAQLVALMVQMLHLVRRRRADAFSHGSEAAQQRRC